MVPFMYVRSLFSSLERKEQYELIKIVEIQKLSFPTVYQVFFILHRPYRINLNNFFVLLNTVVANVVNLTPLSLCILNQL